MTTTYIAFNVPNRMKENNEQFLKNMDNKVSTPQAPLVVDIANDFVDTILEVLFHGPTQTIHLNAVTEKIVNTLGSLLTKTAHTIIKKILSKLSNKELVPLTDYIEERLLELTGKNGETETYGSFPLPEKLATKFQLCFDGINGANPQEQKTAFTEALDEYIDISLNYLYKMPVDKLKLGIISHKLANIGYSAVSKAAHTAIHKIAKDLSDQELVDTAAYFNAIMLDGPTYTGN